MTPNQKKNRQMRKNKSIVIACGTVDVIEAADGSSVPSVSINAYNGGKLRLGNFAHPVVVDMAGVKAMGTQLPILRDHDQKRPVGHGSPLITDANLKMEGSLSILGEETDKLVASQRNGFQWQASIGGSIPNVRKDVTTVAAGSKVRVNGREHEGPLHVVKAFLWKETSFVALGADEERASASVAAAHTSDRGKKMTEFETWLVACGVTEVDDTQRESLKAAFDSMQKKQIVTESSNDMVKAAVESLRSEQQRLSRLDKLFASYKDTASDAFDKIREDAINGSISEDTAHLRLLQESRKLSVSTVAGKAGVSDLEALALEVAAYAESGISAESAVESLSLIAGQATAERAADLAQDAKYRKGSSIGRLIAAACAQAGHYYQGRHTESEIRCAMEHSIKAAGTGFSTVSLSGILGRTANKAMLAAYAESDNAGVVTRIASTTSTSDFKKFDRYRMTETGLMEQVPAAGEVKFGTLSEEAYENQVKTYGKMISLTRTMMINDDLNAFLQIPRMLGRQGRHALEQAGITLLVNATTAAGAGTTEFFHGAVRGNDQINYFEGATTNLSIDSLETAYEFFLNQTDSSGKPIMMAPAILLTTNSEAVMARKLYTDTEYRFTTSSLKESINNQWRGMFRPEVSPYLGRLGTTVNTSQWYLLSEPNTDVSAIQIAFLNGVQTPTIETATLDLSMLGMQWRGIFDFGIGLQDNRCIVKSKGKA